MRTKLSNIVTFFSTSMGLSGKVVEGKCVLNTANIKFNNMKNTQVGMLNSYIIIAKIKTAKVATKPVLIK